MVVLSAFKWLATLVPTEILVATEGEEATAEATEIDTALGPDRDPEIAGEDRGPGLETAEGGPEIDPGVPGIGPGVPGTSPPVPRKDRGVPGSDRRVPRSGPKVRSPSLAPSPRVPSRKRIDPSADLDLDPIPRTAVS